MSVLAHFNWVKFIKTSDLSPKARHVAHVLSTYMNSESDIAWPSQTTLSTETGYHRTTIVRTIKELHQAGYISIHKQKTKQHVHNIYRIQIPAQAMKKAAEEARQAELIPIDLSTGMDKQGGVCSTPLHTPSHTATYPVAHGYTNKQSNKQRNKGKTKFAQNMSKPTKILRTTRNQKIEFPHIANQAAWLELGNKYQLPPKAGESQYQYANRLEIKITELQ